jgi:hypothetical protein
MVGAVFRSSVHHTLAAALADTKVDLVALAAVQARLAHSQPMELQERLIPEAAEAVRSTTTAGRPELAALEVQALLSYLTQARRKALAVPSPARTGTPCTRSLEAARLFIRGNRYGAFCTD